jgi:hypothetical protein
MKGQRIGYVRVSTFDQNVDRQLDGQSLDRIFTDKASGKDINRPELDAMLAFAREGDTVVVHSMDGSVAKIVKLEHAWRRLNGWSDDGLCCKNREA